jgi:hypothetical protein
MTSQDLVVQKSGILGAAVRVVPQSSHRVAPPDCHGQRLGKPAPHRPGNSHARVEVQHHGQIQPALRRPDVGDVAGPHPIGLGHGELTIERVGGDGMRIGRI